MTECKKYYWLKLKDNFFLQKEIKKLRKIAGGEIYTIIYLKMQLLSIKKDGVLMFEKTEDRMSEQLSIEIDEDEKNIEMTLSFLEKNKLIEIIDGHYFIKNIFIGKESDSAERMRKFRKRKEIESSHCDALVTTSDADVQVCYTEIEIEKDLDLDLDLDLKYKKHINNNKPIVYIQKSEGENSFALENIKKTKPATKQRTYKDPFEKLISELNPEDAEDMKKITNLRIFEKCVELLYRLWDADRKGNFLKVKQSFALSIKDKPDVFEELYKLEKASYVYFNTRTKSRETGELMIHNLSKWAGLWENYTSDYYEKLSNKRIQEIKRGDYWRLLSSDADRQDAERGKLERVA